MGIVAVSARQGVQGFFRSCRQVPEEVPFPAICRNPPTARWNSRRRGLGDRSRQAGNRTVETHPGTGLSFVRGQVRRPTGPASIPHCWANPQLHESGNTFMIEIPPGGARQPLRPGSGDAMKQRRPWAGFAFQLPPPAAAVSRRDQHASLTFGRCARGHETLESARP